MLQIYANGRPKGERQKVTLDGIITPKKRRNVPCQPAFVNDIYYFRPYFYLLLESYKPVLRASGS